MFGGTHVLLFIIGAYYARHPLNRLTTSSHYVDAPNLTLLTGGVYFFDHRTRVGGFLIS